MQKIYNWLKKNNFEIWSHRFVGDDLKIEPTDNFNEIDFSAKIPLSSWKQAFFPCQHTLAEFKNPRVKSRSQSRKVALFGARIFDLEALFLYDAVFADDPYYQARRKNILVVGFAPKNEKRDAEILFDKTFAEERLSQVNFDIFFDEKNKKYYCGSKQGEKILKKLKIHTASFGVGAESARRQSASKYWKNYLKWKEVIEGTLDSEVWNKLGKTCLACGKCSIACPTCFCFDIADEFNTSQRKSAPSPRKSALITRNRIWGNCFYQEFHRIAANNFMVDAIRDRIAFWYIHKFSRIPAEYKLRGCVGCGRCHAVCPVDIDIRKNLSRFKKPK